jgi:methyl-accepting chemotaxis protein
MVSAIEEIAKVAGGNGRSINEFNETVRGQLQTLEGIFASAEALAGLAAELEHSLTVFRTQDVMMGMGAVGGRGAEGEPGEAS